MTELQRYFEDQHIHFLLKYSHKLESVPLKWRRKWQPAPVFFPGESHGQRSLADYLTVHGVTRVGHNIETKPTNAFENSKVSFC